MSHYTCNITHWIYYILDTNVSSHHRINIGYKCIESPQDQHWIQMYRVTIGSTLDTNVSSHHRINIGYKYIKSPQDQHWIQMYWVTTGSTLDTNVSSHHRINIGYKYIESPQDQHWIQIYRVITGSTLDTNVSSHHRINTGYKCIESPQDQHCIQMSDKTCVCVRWRMVHINPLTLKQNPSVQRWLLRFFTGLTAQYLYKSFGVERLSRSKEPGKHTAVRKFGTVHSVLDMTLKWGWVCSECALLPRNQILTVNECQFGHCYRGITEGENLQCSSQCSNKILTIKVLSAVEHFWKVQDLLRSEWSVLRTGYGAGHIELQWKCGLQIASGWQALYAVKLPC
jgi:hypothetical protein